MAASLSVAGSNRSRTDADAASLLNLLEQYPVFRATLPTGDVIVTRFLSTLVKTLNERGMVVNRTAIHHALKGPGALYKSIRIERTTLAVLDMTGAELVCP
jgi:hypothetical protein